MRLFRRLFIVSVSLTAGAALCAPSAFATRSVWAKGGQPTCTVTITSAAASATTCTGTLSGEVGVQFLVTLDVTGTAGYQCTDATGMTAPGQNQVRLQGGSSAPFTPTKKSETFAAGPGDLTAPATVSTTQAGCADGTTAADPTLATTKVELTLSTQGDAPVLMTCASDPNGLSGTVALAGC